jgi:N-acetylneuraminic acid mutarotase
MYDPQTDTWIRRQDMSIPRRQFGTGVVDGKIYAVGGWNPFEEPQRLDLVEVYDPVSDTWAKRADMPTRRDDVKVAVVRGIIYVLGGAGWPRVGWGPVLATIEAYQPRTNHWRRKSDMPNLVAGFSTVVVDNKIYLIGGHGGVAFGEYLKSVDVYDPDTERWEESLPMPTGNNPFGAETVNGKIYILGSERENGERSLDVEVFDTGFQSVTAVGKLSTRWGELKVEPQSQP